MADQPRPNGLNTPCNCLTPRFILLLSAVKLASVSGAVPSRERDIPEVNQVIAVDPVVMLLVRAEFLV